MTQFQARLIFLLKQNTSELINILRVKFPLPRREGLQRGGDKDFTILTSVRDRGKWSASRARRRSNRKI
jgi:hypothetical protein